MVANSLKQETSLLEWAVGWLVERLPENWTVDLDAPEEADGSPRTDGRLILQSPGSNAWVAVEARRSLSPKEAENLLPRLAQVLRSMSGNAPVLIVAPWLSSRTRDLLAQQGINYLDRTGNALIKLPNPAVYIESRGSSQNPNPKGRGEIRLRGPKAGRLLRTLVDVRPPYTLKELAAATELAPGYISRTLEALDREALIRRPPRGAVEAVDVPALLRRWAASYDVFKSNRLLTFIAAEGWETILSDLTLETRKGAQIAFTGSFAAFRLAPVASPAMLLAYTPEPELLATRLRLLPASEGANVGFLWPFDPVVWGRTRWSADGLQFAAPSQIAVDCLTGNGRMPAEGEALLAWMTENEAAWRRDSFEDRDRRDDGPEAK
jgi:hypothetical protein